MKKFLVLFLAILIPLVIFGLDFSFYNADLRNVINDVSRTYNVQVIIADDLSGTVDMTFQANSFEEALQKILLTTNYSFAKVDNFYIVGSLNSPDKIRSTIYKPSVVFLKNIKPSVAYDLLGTMSKYVLYSDNSNLLLIYADEQVTSKVTEMISKIDVAGTNKFFFYEIHEMASDEYQRFRQIEQINQSGILTFSDNSFEIFREIMKINGIADTFGTIMIPQNGKAMVDATDPQFVMNIVSDQNTVNVSLITGVNALQIDMNDQKPHAIASVQVDKKHFIVLMGFSDSINEDLAFEKQKPQNKFGVDVFYNQTSSLICGIVSYGSTDLSISGEFYQTRLSTTGIFVGMTGNLIDQMYGKVMLGLENSLPTIQFGIKDTTQIGIFKLRGEVYDEWQPNVFLPVKITIGIGMEVWNIEVFGGIRGELQSAEPYIETILRYEWIKAKLSWEQTNGYTLGGGIAVNW